MSPHPLECRALVSGYNAIVAVNDVDIEVRRGEVTALIGSNGAGKSTILRTLSGLLSPMRGEISFEGRDILGLSADARVDCGIVMVPEGRMIFPQMTVEENLRLGAFAPRARPFTGQTIGTVFELFPRLAERRRQAGGTLSGGEQQMLALGRGMMAKPEVLLLDEPTLGLAPLMAELIFHVIEKLRDSGLSILLAEQDVGKTLALASSAYVIESGRIAMTGSGEDLLGDPKVKEAYLGI